MKHGISLATIALFACSASGCTTMTATPAPVAPATGEVAALTEHVRGIRHIGITVSDIDSTLAFYGRAVSVQLVRRYTAPASAFPAALRSGSSGVVDVALVRTPTVFLQLMDFDPGRAAAPISLPVQGPGYTHICFQSPSTNPGYARFRAAGLAMITPGDGPVDVGGYGVTYAYGRDPDGTMIEMEQVDRPRRNDSEWVSHVALTTPDIDRMLAFYQQVIGYAPHRRVTTSNPRLMRIANLDHATIHGGWFATRNLEMEIWQYVDPPTPAGAAPRPIDRLGHALIAFEVRNLAAGIARLRAANVVMVGRPVTMGGWRIQYARDPDGNLFALQEDAGAGPTESIESMRWLDPASYRRPAS